MSPVDRNALLSLWKLDEIPACDKGMELSQAFLVCAGEFVDRFGVKEPGYRLTAAYMARIVTTATNSFVRTRNIYCLMRTALTGFERINDL
ncbi:hypothetical protein HDF16_002166 [Granulicella aggregans]|uniref:Uncharacterized protein n=1 Tax=Granulicella aggregans TaxID=474949 RepID=A0A7W7ZCM3_9BACT|nr:hypothetical protein [Granulicella aggregans]MBB5057460.1 hypothetical protein [Granulicella aggregans]